MKTSTFATFATFAAFTTACAGQPFTTAEEASRLPDVSPTVVVAAAPEAEPTQQPDAGPTEVPGAPLAAVAPDAGTSKPDASPVNVEDALPDAAPPEPDAVVQEPDAAPDAPVSTPVKLCDASDLGFFAFAPETLDFGSIPVGTTASRAIQLADRGDCSAAVDTSFDKPQGEFAETDDCTVLSPGQTCTIAIVFSPKGAGRASAQGQVTISGVPYDYTVIGVGE